MGLGKKIKINFKPKSEPELLDVNFISKVLHSGMEAGYGYLMWSRQKVRCIRVRRYCMCKYVLIGFDRGRVVPVIRNFQKIRRPMTENEIKKVEWWMERHKRFL